MIEYIFSNMSRCIGLTKNKKPCRSKTKKGIFFCCEQHKPLNKEVLSEPCLMCSQDILTTDIKILKCNHAFHKACLKEFFSYCIGQLTCPMCRFEIKMLYCKKDKKQLTFIEKHTFKEDELSNILNLKY